MREEKLSVRQLAVAAFTGGLAPAAAGAGTGWQGALLALPVILLAGWALTALAPRWPALAGRRAGRALGALYALFGALLLARGLARCAGRVLLISGAGEGLRPGVILLLALPLAWMARGRPGAFFRLAEVCYLAMAAAAAALLLWGLTRVERDYLAAPADSLTAGALAALETGGTFLFALPHLGRTEPGPGDRRRAMAWLGALGGASVLLAAVTAGVLSPPVAALGSEPFFLMTASLGATVRVEGLASALWLLADLVYLGLLARSWRRAGTEKSWLPPAAVALGAGGACTGVTGLLPEWFWGMGTVILAAAAIGTLLRIGKMPGPGEKNSAPGPG